MSHRFQMKGYVRMKLPEENHKDKALTEKKSFSTHA